MVLPHEYMYHLCREWPAAFERRARGPEESIIDWWQQARRFGWYAQHPARMFVEADPGKVIPVRIYGDDAQYNKQRTLTVFTFSSILCKLPSQQSRFLVALLPVAASTKETYDKFYDVVQWSFLWLLRGQWPDSDHLGNPWPPSSWRSTMAGRPLFENGFRFAVVQVLGDWKFLKEAFSLEFNYNTRACCHKCEAVKEGDGPPFDDFGPAARHRQTRRTTQQYLARFIVPPPLSRLPGFHLDMLACDPMHCVHLGVLQWIIGSLLVVLAQSGHWGIFAGDAVTRLNLAMRVAFGEFVTWCKQRAVHTSQEPFTAAMLNRSEKQAVFPKFKCKAANGRWVGMWLNDVFVTRNVLGLEAAVIWGVCEMLHIMHEHHRAFLSRREASRFVRGGTCMLRSYAALALKAKGDGLALWCIKPKHHLLSHLIDHVGSSCENPSVFWTFCDEDFNGRMAKMSGNLNAKQFSLRAMERYVLGLYLGLKREPA